MPRIWKRNQAMSNTRLRKYYVTAVLLFSSVFITIFFKTISLYQEIIPSQFVVRNGLRSLYHWHWSLFIHQNARFQMPLDPLCTKLVFDADRPNGPKSSHADKDLIMIVSRVNTNLELLSSALQNLSQNFNIRISGNMENFSHSPRVVVSESKQFLHNYEGFPKAKHYWINGIREQLNNSTNICHFLYRISRLIGNIQSPCYMLPENSDDFKHMGNQSFHVQSAIGSQAIYMPTDQIIHFSLVTRSSGSPLIVRPVMHKDFLRLYGFPFCIRMYALVTSVKPQRWYIYGNLAAFYLHSESGRPKIAKNVIKEFDISQLASYILLHHGQAAVRLTFDNLDSAIRTATQAALDDCELSEEATASGSRFQIIQFDVAFNTSFYPVILDVSIPSITSLLSAKLDLVTFLLRDTFTLLINSTSALPSLCSVLTEYLRLVPNPVGLDLTSEDRFSLVQALAEKVFIGHFKPVVVPFLPEPVARFLHVYNYSNEHTYNTQDYYEIELRRSLFGVVKPIKPIQNLFSAHRAHASLPNPLQHPSSNVSCSYQESHMPFLRAINLPYPFSLNSTFNPHVRRYSVNVPFNTSILVVSATPKHCEVEVRLKEPHGVSRSTSVVLGVGGNEKIIYVVKEQPGKKQIILSTYTLYIYRENRPGISKLHPKLKACSLYQDCNLPFLESKQCGLLDEISQSWYKFLSTKSSLANSRCNSHKQINGRWIVPCISCNNEKSCAWHNASWQPSPCSYPAQSLSTLKSFFSNKQVLFIGDSTVRGMMYAFIQMMNNSVQEWKKIHSSFTYTNVNLKRTAVAFSYFPRFWLPVHKRPSFKDALREVFAKRNKNMQTRILIGGSQWLSADIFKHIQDIAVITEEFGIDRKSVVIKTLGAGFHQIVDGIYVLNQTDFLTLERKNRIIINIAADYNFRTLDTFAMTMSRFKEFRPGRCACHFHDVKRIKSSHTYKTRYEVVGAINEAYTKNFMNMLYAASIDFDRLRLATKANGQFVYTETQNLDKRTL